MMSIEGWSWTLMKNCPLSQQQTLHALEPFNYQMPHTEAAFQQLLDRLKRVGHQAENRAGTVARMLGNHLPSHDGRAHYHALQDEDIGPQDASPAFMMQPGAQIQASSSSSWQIQPSWTPWQSSGASSAAQPDTSMCWGNCGGSWRAGQQGAPQEQPYDLEMSSSATSSDDGNEYVEAPDLTRMSEPEAAEHVFLMYRRHEDLATIHRETYADF